jgi:hypothetical protein
LGGGVEELSDGDVFIASIAKAGNDRAQRLDRSPTLVEQDDCAWAEPLMVADGRGNVRGGESVMPI